MKKAGIFLLALMAAAAIIGVNNARSAAASADSLVSDQLLIVQLLDQVESEQNVLTAAIYRLSGDPGDVDRHVRHPGGDQQLQLRQAIERS